MAMCPLLREECREEQCAWWHKFKSEGDGRCVVAELPFIWILMGDIKNNVIDIHKRMGDMGNDVIDIYNRLVE